MNRTLGFRYYGPLSDSDGAETGGIYDMRDMYKYSTQGLWPLATNYLLDISGLPAPLAAYSTRKLRSSYTGDCAMVQSSGGTDYDIGFVDGEYDVDTAWSHFSGSQAYVKKWYDQSGNGNDLTQSTQSQMPHASWAGGSAREGFGTNNRVEWYFPDASNDVLTLDTELTTIRAGHTVRSWYSYRAYAGGFMGDVSTIPDFIAQQSTGVLLASSYADANAKNATWRMNESGVTPINNVISYGTDYQVNFTGAAGNLVADGLSSERNIANRYFYGNIAELIVWDTDITSYITDIEANTSDWFGV